ncbi:uncharacterized protein LOC142227063 isoform X2 [Haematobia irritans]|uniref:uncharacterized protein LOC142227063 isoform X2 n=1 Tax=Haematobia irritans TaxID=7368 RepID=UPI003F4FF6F8
MTKTRKESPTKNTSSSKKRNSDVINKNMESFLKKQKDSLSNLKAELKDSLAEIQQTKCVVIEKDKCIQELQTEIEGRNNEIVKLRGNLNEAKEINVKTLHDFYIFKEKFCELEVHYATVSNIQNREIESLKQEVDRHKSSENLQIKELEQMVRDLQQQLYERNQSLAHIKLDYSELLQNYERSQKEVEKIQKDFENYRQMVLTEKNIYDEKLKEFNSLKDELSRKDDNLANTTERFKQELLEKDNMIRKCTKDKEIVEEEKNRKIEELNYKIKQIEKVFGQPTKAVAPMTVIPGTPENSDNSIQEKTSAPESKKEILPNVAVTKPQFHRSFQEIISSDDQYPKEKASRSRSKKIPRLQKANSTANENVSKNEVNQKRGYQRLKNPSPPKHNEFSTTSGDDDDDIPLKKWCPNIKNGNVCIPETETDASDLFVSTKRSKKLY